MLFKVLFVACFFVQSIQGVRKCGLNPNVIHLKRGEKTQVSYWTEEEPSESIIHEAATSTQLPATNFAESRQGIGGEEEEEEEDRGDRDDHSPSDFTVSSVQHEDVPGGMTTSKVTDDDVTTAAVSVREDEGVTDQPQMTVVQAGDETEFITTATPDDDGAGESIVTESTADVEEHTEWSITTEVPDEVAAGTTESIAWTDAQIEGSGGADEQVFSTTISPPPVIPVFQEQQQQQLSEDMAAIQIEIVGETMFKTLEGNGDQLQVTTEAGNDFLQTTKNDDGFETTTVVSQTSPESQTEESLEITHKIQHVPQAAPEAIPDVEFIRADETDQSIGTILREMSHTVQIPQEDIFEQMAQMKAAVEPEVHETKKTVQATEPQPITTTRPVESEASTAVDQDEVQSTTNWPSEARTQEPNVFAAADSLSSMAPEPLVDIAEPTEIPESATEAQVAEERTDSEPPPAEFRNDDILINRIRTIVESLTNPKETPFFRRTSDFIQSVFQRRQERSAPMNDAADLIRRSDPSFIRFLRAQPLPMRRALSANFAGRFSRHIDDLSSDGNQANGEQECDLHIKTEPTLHLLLTFHNLSAPYTVDCAGAYVEIEREGNGFEARWCGNPIGQQRGVRSHVIFARSEVRVSVYNNHNILRQQVKPNEGHNDLDASSDSFVEELVPTGFHADVEVIDLHDAGEYKTFQRSEAYSSVRRRVG